MSTRVRRTAARIGPRSAGLRLTAREFDAIDGYDDRYRYELIRGVLVVSPIAGPWEADPNSELGFLLRLYQYQHPEGSALDLTLFEQYIHLSDEDRRRADRVIWAGLGRLPDLELDVPTIAVEFVSGSRRDWLRDYETKRDEYLALGILEYWIFDRFARKLTVWKPGEGGFQSAEIGEADTYRTPLLPGFELPVGRILAVADRWSKNRPGRGRGGAP